MELWPDSPKLLHQRVFSVQSSHFSERVWRGVILERILVRNIAEPEIRQKLRNFASTRSHIPFSGTNGVFTLNILFSVFEFLDQFVLVAPKLTGTPTGEKEMVLFELEGNTFKVDFDFRFPKVSNQYVAVQVKDDLEFAFLWTENTFPGEFQKYAIVRSEEWQSVSSTKLGPIPRQTCNGVFKDILTDPLQIAVFRFPKLEIDADTTDFLKVLNSLDFCEPEVFRWLMLTRSVSTSILIQLKSQIGLQHQSNCAAQILAKVLKAEFRSMFRTGPPKLDSLFLIDFVNTAFLWVFSDPGHLHRTCLPSFIRLFIRSVFPNLDRLPPFLSKKLRHIITNCGRNGPNFANFLQLEFGIRFESVSLSEFFRLPLSQRKRPPSIHQCFPKAWKSASLPAFLESELHPDNSFRLVSPHLTALFTSPKAFVAEYSLKINSFEGFLALEMDTEHFLKLMDAVWRVQADSQSLSLPTPDGLLLTNLLSLLSIFTYHSNADRMTKEKRQLIANVLADYLLFLRSKLDRLNIASQVVDYLGGELVKMTRSRPALTILEEVFTENYRNVQLNRQRKGSSLTPGTRFSERRVTEDTATRQATQQTETLRNNFRMILFSLVWGDQSLVNMDTDKSLESSAVLFTNSSLRVTPGMRVSSNQTPRGSSTKRRTVNSLTNLSIEPNSDQIEIETAELIRTKLGEDLQGGLLTLGFDNFGQLGFPREMFTYQICRK